MQIMNFICYLLYIVKSSLSLFLSKWTLTFKDNCVYKATVQRRAGRKKKKPSICRNDRVIRTQVNSHQLSNTTTSRLPTFPHYYNYYLHCHHFGSNLGKTYVHPFSVEIVVYLSSCSDLSFLSLPLFHSHFAQSIRTTLYFFYAF